MEKLIEMLRVAFANNFTWYLQSHNYHFNVGGSDFPEHHEFLGEIYADAQSAIDEYGEKVRRLGAFNLGSYPEIITESLLADPKPGLTDPKLMYEQLLADNATIIGHLQDAYDIAGPLREYGIQNFLADRIDQHQMWAWMIKSTLGQLP